MLQQQQDKTYDDHPIITYSNRIQKHLFQLTIELAQNNNIELTEKRKLKLLIANLPPAAKNELQDIIPKLEAQTLLTTLEFDRMYGRVSDWIYKNILQDAFAIKPISKINPHITSDE